MFLILALVFYFWYSSTFNMSYFKTLTQVIFLRVTLTFTRVTATLDQLTVTLRLSGFCRTGPKLRTDSPAEIRHATSVGEFKFILFTFDPGCVGEIYWSLNSPKSLSYCRTGAVGSDGSQATQPPDHISIHSSGYLGNKDTVTLSLAPRNVWVCVCVCVR